MPAPGRATPVNTLRLDPMRPGTLGHAALSYARNNIKIFPTWWTTNGVCQCADRDTCGSPAKHPLVAWRTETTANPDTIRAWWQRWPNANIGLPAGDNQLAIIDVDPRHDGNTSLTELAAWCDTYGVDLYATRIIRTGSGGSHFYFHAPHGGIKTAGRTFRLPGVDTRGNGGYVVAPPSIHACGQPYEIVHNNHTTARWPAILTDRINWRPPQPQPTTNAGSPPPAPAQSGGGTLLERRLRAWAANGLKLECDTLRALPDSGGNGRNQRLYRAAVSAGLKYDARLLDNLTTIENDLYTAASGWTGHGPREIMATIRSGLDWARGHGTDLRLPPWATSYTITTRG